MCDIVRSHRGRGVVWEFRCFPRLLTTPVRSRSEFVALTARQDTTSKKCTPFSAESRLHDRRPTASWTTAPPMMLTSKTNRRALGNRSIPGVDDRSPATCRPASITGTPVCRQGSPFELHGSCHDAFRAGRPTPGRVWKVCASTIGIHCTERNEKWKRLNIPSQES